MNRKPRVFLIGGAAYDVQGHPNTDLVPRDSNPGRISVSFGGVARNIAENLGRLGAAPVLITAVGDDHFGKALTVHAREAGIVTDRILNVLGWGTAGYIAIMGTDGDMELAVSDMSILDCLTEDTLEQQIRDIRAEDIAVLDTNLPPARIEWLANRLPCRIFADPISAGKAPRIRGALDRIHTIKPNRFEAEALTGIGVTNAQDALAAARAILAMGAKKVCVNLSGEGAVMAQGKSAWGLRARNIQVRSATGAGDAFMAGLILAELEERSPVESLRMATCCAAAALASPHAVSTELNRTSLKEAMECIEMEEIL